MELDYVGEWFQYADSDLSSAEYLQGKHPLPLEIICYLCEQSAEKLLKGYLIYKGFSDVPKTHNLTLLGGQCKSFDVCQTDSGFCAIRKGSSRNNRKKQQCWRISKLPYAGEQALSV